MADPVNRFCPSCGASVKASPEAFSKPAKCPKCGKVVTFHDHPNAAPTPTVVAKRPRKKEPLDYAVYVALYSVPVLALTGLLCMAFGENDVSVLISSICLISSALLLAKFSHLNSTISNLREDFSEQKQLADIRSKDLEDAIERYQGFKTNFDSLVAAKYADADAKLKSELIRASEMDEESQRKLNLANERNNTIDRLGKRLLNDSVKWIGSKITPNNFTASRDRLIRVIEFCRKHEFEVDRAHEKGLIDDLREEFEDALRKQHAREEQQRIKARIREEQRAEKELEREMRRIESERNAIEKALAVALRKAKDEHSEEVEALRQKLLEAEERAQRAKSMAELTKAGHVYVISNIGSFGEGVYKVGMTRRLEPLDRVKELGDASVPFPFDVHMMISCDDAPALENAIHRTLHARRLNKVNLRREFFRADLEEIHKLVLENHGEVEYVAEPEALQYRESLEMSDEDFDYLSGQAESFAFDEDDEFLDD